MNFSTFKTAVAAQFATMKDNTLYRTTVSKDDLWKTYLSSFPEGTNPIYKERTEYDCQCCRGFIRTVGNLVTIVDGKLVSIWDANTGHEAYQAVADALSTLVKSAPIENMFLHTESKVGVDKNFSQLDSGEAKTWEHFYMELPVHVLISGTAIGPKLSETRSTKDVFCRSLNEISIEAIDIVLELIEQNSLYRGEEHKGAIQGFLKQKKAFGKITDSIECDCFYWQPNASRIRNTVIGTLLTDISGGADLDHAVKSFETKVAPANYKRPTALITKTMIAKAQKTVEELGFAEALPRRYAVDGDVTVNNVLYADRGTKAKMKGSMDVFEEMAAAVPMEVKSLDKVDEVSVEVFMADILPKADSIELMVENRHAGNFVSLISPVNQDAKCMLKWKNNFSWAYAGELADSVKERVKQAGGSVDGDLRCSLAWYNYDDLDLHLEEPHGNRIHFGNKRNRLTGGELDVDMNAGGRDSRSSVENITYPERRKMQEGRYHLFVNNYAKRETSDVGFEVEMEFDGTLYTFNYAKALVDRENVTVAEFEYSHANGLKIIKSLPSTQASKKVWSVHTQQFQKVSMIMHSPNHWDGEETGNRHYFFMLEGCKQPGKARGFFNEFLTEDLREHRKVIEVLGSKMKAEESDDQLSGLGFSSTQRNNVFCRVAGSFTRTIKLTF